jgi:hypothetical protein
MRSWWRFRQRLVMALIRRAQGRRPFCCHCGSLAGETRVLMLDLPGGLWHCADARACDWRLAERATQRKAAAGYTWRPW